MTLPVSGTISMQSVNIELAKAATALISLNDTDVRTLFGVSSGQISLADGYGKSRAPAYTMDASSIIFSQQGIYSFFLPNNVSSISGVAIGGGGGGGRAGPGGSNSRGGGGGGGGALSYIPINAPYTTGISGGTLLTIGVGAGGATTFTPQGSGSPGGDSFVQIAGANVILAKGGAGGTFNTVSLGGQNTQGIGTARFSGGNSRIPIQLNYGAGGGGAAGYNGNGGNSSESDSEEGQPGVGGGGGGGAVGREVEGGGEGGSTCARLTVNVGSFTSGNGGEMNASELKRKGFAGSTLNTNVADFPLNSFNPVILYGGGGGAGATYLPSNFTDTGQTSGSKGVVQINMLKTPAGSTIADTVIVSCTFAEVTTGTPVITLPASTQFGDMIFLQLVSRKTTTPSLSGTGPRQGFTQITTIASSAAATGYYRAEAFYKKAELTDVGTTYSGMTVVGTAESLIVAWVVRTNTCVGQYIQRSVTTPTSSAAGISLNRQISSPYDLYAHGFPLFTAISYSTGSSTRSTNRDLDSRVIRTNTPSGRFTLISYNPSSAGITSIIFSMTDGGVANYIFGLAGAVS